MVEHDPEQDLQRLTVANDVSLANLIAVGGIASLLLIPAYYVLRMARRMLSSEKTNP